MEKYRIEYASIGRPSDIWIMQLDAHSLEDAAEKFHKVYSKEQMIIEYIGMADSK